MRNYLMLVAIVGLLFASCKKDDNPQVEDYTVNITIEEPTANATVAVNSPMAVKVNYSRATDQIIHHVKIYVLDANGETIETLLDEHAHVPETYSYENNAAYTPTVAGTYKIKAMTHDMEGNHADPLEVSFTAN